MAGYGAVGYALVFLTWGTFQLNRVYYDAPPSETWPLVVVPIISGFAAIVFFAGVNWGRIVYWLIIAAFPVLLALYSPRQFWKFYLPLFLFGALVAGPGAHWYFTGRDFRRRPGYKAYFDKQTNEQRKRQFEY